ncbi:MAG: cyclic nucleotide-binding domain-containing protein [Gallionella sp.]
MSVADVIGWAAGGLVLTTFYLQTMLPLRCVAIASNLAFLSYGLMTDALPIAVLHALLLPMNLWRLGQLRARMNKLKVIACKEFPIDSLLPYLTTRKEPRGTVLFSNGTAGNELLLILAGQIRIVESGSVMGPGEVIGETSAFRDDRQSTITAMCITDIELASVPADKVWEAVSTSPEFAAHMLRLILHRYATPDRRPGHFSSASIVPGVSHRARSELSGQELHSRALREPKFGVPAIEQLR